MNGMADSARMGGLVVLRTAREAHRVTYGRAVPAVARSGPGTSS